MKGKAAEAKPIHHEFMMVIVGSRSSKGIQSNHYRATFVQSQKRHEGRIVYPLLRGLPPDDSTNYTLYNTVPEQLGPHSSPHHKIVF